MRKTIEWCMEHDDHVMLSEDDGSCEIEEYDLVPVGSLADDPQAVANILSNELMMLMNHMPRMGGPNLNEQKWGQALAQKLVDEGVLRAAEGEQI